MRSMRVSRALSDSASARLISLKRLIRSSSFAWLRTGVDVTVSFKGITCEALVVALSRGGLLYGLMNGALRAFFESPFHPADNSARIANSNLLISDGL